MYKSRRRPWVKLYCREWLTSTVRLNLTEQDRSRFIDLLAMAGDSKVPGVVCAGYENGQLVGYPVDWIGSMMRCTVEELRKTLEKLTKSGRVTISQTKSDLVEMTSPDSNPIIRITGWNKFQSEYLRQIQSGRGNLKLQSSLQIDEQTSASSLHSPQTEVEVEREVEVEVERETDKEAGTKPSVMTGFPDWISPEAWRGFVEMRNKKKKPMTDRAIFLAIKTLERLKAAGNSPEEVLNQSVLNCWTGLFEINNRQAGNGDRPSFTQRRNERTKAALDKAFGPDIA